MDSTTSNTLVVLDFDRMLSDPNAVVEELKPICLWAGVDPIAMTDAQAETEASGGSFDIMGYLEEQSDPETVSYIQQTFVSTQPGERILYSHTLPILELLEEAEIPTMIATYGSNGSQNMKIVGSALGYLPRLVSQIKHKGEMISTWRQENGLYLPPSGVFRACVEARNVHLLDDKAHSFKGLPSADENAYGHWYQQLGIPILRSQMGELPRNVEIMTDPVQTVKNIIVLDQAA